MSETSRLMARDKELDDSQVRETRNSLGKMRRELTPDLCLKQQRRKIYIFR